jgi:hypothetical protein
MTFLIESGFGSEGEIVKIGVSPPQKLAGFARPLPI